MYAWTVSVCCCYLFERHTISFHLSDVALAPSFLIYLDQFFTDQGNPTLASGFRSGPSLSHATPSPPSSEEQHTARL